MQFKGLAKFKSNLAYYMRLVCFFKVYMQKQSSGVLRNFAKFTGKHLWQSVFFNKVAGLTTTLLKKRLWHRHRSFSVFLYIKILA